jgi:hypothetical protein
MASPPARPAPQEQHLREEKRVLFELLERFPAQLRFEELRDRVNRFVAEPSQNDFEVVDESVIELVGNGLAFRQGRLVVPTLAARHFDLLLEHAR